MGTIELIRAFQTLGCTNKVKCAIAARVHVDLQDSIKSDNLDVQYDEALDMIYFHCESEIIVPHSTCTEMNILEMESIQEKYGGNDMSVTYALCDPNSTILYYKMTNKVVDK